MILMCVIVNIKVPSGIQTWTSGSNGKVIAAAEDAVKMQTRKPHGKQKGLREEDSQGRGDGDACESVGLGGKVEKWVVVVRGGKARTTQGRQERRISNGQNSRWRRARRYILSRFGRRIDRQAKSRRR